jgi:hypothetical protein
MEYEDVVERLRAIGDLDDEARILMGELGVLSIRTWGWGAISSAAKDAAIPYKTFAERTRVVEFYGTALRELRAELPSFRWKRFVMAKGLKDKDAAIQLLLDTAGMDSEHEFVTELQKRRKQQGLPAPKRIVTEKAGWRTTITKME